jgi:hypothetical protein
VRRLAVLGALAACGTVAAPSDAPSADSDLGTLRNGCALLEHMDEAAWTGATGEVRDDCGGDNNGTALGGITTVAGGVRGRAGSFDGNGCIEIADAPALHASTGLTISAWVNPTSLDAADAFGIVSKRIDTGNQAAYSVYVWTGDHVWVDLDGENDRFSGVAVIQNNVWTQITVVYDGSEVQQQRVHVFVNGALDITSGETSATLPPLTSPLHVGCLPSSVAVQNWKGLLDEVGVWTRPLTGAEIAQWYEQTKP